MVLCTDVVEQAQEVLMSAPPGQSGHSYFSIRVYYLQRAFHAAPLLFFLPQPLHHVGRGQGAGLDGL